MTPALHAEIHLTRSSGFRLDATIDVEPGATAALVGPNGAGKSSTISALAGLAPIEAGRITLGDRVLDDPGNGIFVRPEERRIGIVFQDYLLFESMTVLDNVAFGPASVGMGRRHARLNVTRWIDALDLGELVDRRPRELSGGQAQRVALARALAIEPDLLLLDEPLAALDVETRATLRHVLLDHTRQFAGPCLIITHDPTDAFLLADTIHVLENGSITQAAIADEIRQRPATPYVAALAGTNLLSGVNTDGIVDLDDHDATIQTADTHTAGRVLVTVHPTAIAIHRDQPQGSPRNTWPTTIRSIEPLGETTRLVLDRPLPLSVDITPAATEALQLVPGTKVWASVKATEVAVAPAG